MFAAVDAIFTLYGEGGMCKSSSCSQRISHERPGVACDALIVRSLTQSLISHELWPLPNSPYTGYSVRGIKEKLMALEILSLADLFQPAYHVLTKNSKSHGVHHRLETSTAQIEASLQGFDLTWNSVGSTSKKRSSSRIS